MHPGCMREHATVVCSVTRCSTLVLSPADLQSKPFCKRYLPNRFREASCAPVRSGACCTPVFFSEMQPGSERQRHRVGASSGHALDSCACSSPARARH